MIKNRISVLIYRSIFITLSFLGLMESFGLFAGQKLGFNCLLFYTTLSNIFCFIVMIFVLKHNVKELKTNKEYNYNKFLTSFKFYATIAILVTFLVYNILLTDNMFGSGWNSLGNLTKHIVCPLLFIFDYILFDKHHQLKFRDCFLCTVLPLVYVIFILIRGALLPANYEGTTYPYFFLDASSIGYLKVFLWVLVLVVIFIALAIVFYLYDKLEIKNGKIKFEIKNKQN